MHRYLAAMLVALMVLTGNSMAAARGQVMADGQIVICTGTGPVAIWVDAQGQPAPAPHICPDCALTFFDAATAAIDLPGHMGPTRRIDTPIRLLPTPSWRAIVPRAREPPVAV